MTEERHDRTELGERRVEHRTKEQREQEEDEQDARVPHDRPDGDDGNTNERARGLLAVLVRERLDEHVRDDEEGGQDDGEDDLREYNRPPLCPRYVARETF